MDAAAAAGAGGVSLIAIIGVVVYGLIGLVCWRAFAGALAWRSANKWRYTEPESWQWGAGIAGGALGAAIWPVVLLALGARAPFIAIMGRPPFVMGAERRAVETRRQLQLEEAQRRIAQLEREAGIGD
jgi:hypothetical protein